MKKAMVIAAMFGLLTVPALAQSSTANGTTPGGPARVGIPGQVGGGVPGTRPSMGPRPRMMRGRMMRHRMMRRRRMMKR